jgi:hypothetical protein
VETDIETLKTNTKIDIVEKQMWIKYGRKQTGTEIR